MSIEDMDLTPISPTFTDTDGTNGLNNATSESDQPKPKQAQASMPSVELSFSTGPGGAWDDRELIRASEAAMSEFYAHHGRDNGSWLDQATAALAQGRALPGADEFRTAWYAATPSVPFGSTHPPPPPPAGSAAAQISDISSSASAAPAPPMKKARRNPPPQKQKPKPGPSNPNPYAPTASTHTHTQSSGNGNGNGNGNGARRPSPTYVPASPARSDQGEDFAEEGEEDAEQEEEEEEEYDEDAEWDIQEYDYHLPSTAQRQSRTQGSNDILPSTSALPAAAPAIPALGVQPIAGVSRDDALGYAMTAQYWAGYWSGVAQTLNEGRGEAGDAEVAGSVPVPAHQAEPTQQQNRPAMNGLRR